MFVVVVVVVVCKFKFLKVVIISYLLSCLSILGLKSPVMSAVSRKNIGENLPFSHSPN